MKIAIIGSGSSASIMIWWCPDPFWSCPDGTISTFLTPNSTSIGPENLSFVWGLIKNTAASSCDAFLSIIGADKKMSSFISKKLDVNLEKAKKIQ